MAERNTEQVMRVPPHNIATAMIPSISHALPARLVEDIMPSLPRVHGDDIDDDEEEVVGPRPSFVYEHTNTARHTRQSSC